MEKKGTIEGLYRNYNNNRKHSTYQFELKDIGTILGLSSSLNRRVLIPHEGIIVIPHGGARSTLRLIRLQRIDTRNQMEGMENISECFLLGGSNSYSRVKTESGRGGSQKAEKVYCFIDAIYRQTTLQGRILLGPNFKDNSTNSSL